MGFWTPFLPILGAILTGAISYILNYPLVQSIFELYAGTPWAYQLTLFRAALQTTDLLVFFGSWILMGLITGWRTKHPIKGIIVPPLSFAAANILHILLLSVNYGIPLDVVLTQEISLMSAAIIPGLIALVISSRIGGGVGYYRKLKAEAGEFNIKDPIIEFIDKCPNCKRKNHSNAIYCVQCGTEIYIGHAKEAVSGQIE